MNAFLTRPIEGAWPHLWIDATYLKAREAGRIASASLSSPSSWTAREDVLATMTFPREHWPQIASTNPPERLNGEIKRRADVIGICPTTGPSSGWWPR